MNRAAVCILTLLAASAAAEAQTEPNLKNAGVLMVIGFAPGGGTDGAGRLIAANLGRHLPGAPSSSRMFRAPVAPARSTTLCSNQSQTD